MNKIKTLNHHPYSFIVRTQLGRILSASITIGCSSGGTKPFRPPSLLFSFFCVCYYFSKGVLTTRDVGHSIFSRGNASVEDRRAGWCKKKNNIIFFLNVCFLKPPAINKKQNFSTSSLLLPRIDSVLRRFCSRQLNSVKKKKKSLWCLLLLH